MKKILLDIGGTFIKCSDGREVPIDSAGSRESIVASLREAVADYDCIRAAVPGPFNYETGCFLMKHKFAAVYDEYFQDIVGVKDCKFVHDVNCLLLGGQISRSWELFAPAIEHEFAACGVSISISPISDFGNATFNGLAAL